MKRNQALEGEEHSVSLSSSSSMDTELDENDEGSLRRRIESHLNKYQY